MAKRTQKAGASAKYGPRYGVSVRRRAASVLKKRSRKFYALIFIGLIAILSLTGGFVIVQKAPGVVADMWEAALIGDFDTVFGMFGELGARVTGAVSVLAE